MRIAYFDCFSGVSGNMILGALLDIGLPLDQLEEDLQCLHLPGWELRTEKSQRGAMTGTHVEVAQTSHEHVHRTINDIERIVTASDLPQATQDKAMAVFARLAKAEARIHGIPETEVHFHEVGAIDAIVDVVGAIAGLSRLNVDAIYASPIHLGTGFVEAAHGKIPIPAPATLEILRGVPVYATDVQGELTTPTGAAILRTVVQSFGPWPAITVEKLGYGLGTKHFAIPNVLRLAIGSLHEEHHHHHEHGVGELAGDRVEILEANLDDMNPEFSEHVTESLLQAGALDVYFTPIVMKKGRLATKLTVLATAATADACIATALRETTTLGVRRLTAHRHKLNREWLDVPVAGDTVRVKLGRWEEEIVNIAPEYEDCRRVAVATARPLKTVYDQAKAEVYANLRLE